MGQFIGREWPQMVVFSRELRANLGNFHVVHHRRTGGFLISARNSGTHWLKYMLSHAMAAQYGLPPPARSSGEASEDFICHPKRASRHPGVPRITTSHSVCSTLVGEAWLARAVALPPIVVLVRDPVQAMLSFHLKWGQRYGVDLEEYAALPASLGRPLADAWWYVGFFNAWGRIAEKQPSRVLVVRYEDLRADPRAWLTRIAHHYGLELGPHAIEAALSVSSRQAVGAAEDPAFGETVVPAEGERRAVALRPSVRRNLHQTFARHLRHDFGYGYLNRREAADRLPRSGAALALAFAYTLFSLFGRPMLGIELPPLLDHVELTGEFAALALLGPFAFPKLGLAWTKYVALAPPVIEFAQLSPAVPGSGSLGDLAAEWLGVLAVPLTMLIAVRAGLSLRRRPLRTGAQHTDSAWS